MGFRWRSHHERQIRIRLSKIASDGSPLMLLLCVRFETRQGAVSTT